MTIFHKTLQDAIHALEKGDVNTCRDILRSHEAAELKEQTYIESSLYAIRLYLKNYISHLYMAMESLSKEDLPDDEKKRTKENIAKCMKNMQAFEESITGLMKREGTLLE